MKTAVKRNLLQLSQNCKKYLLYCTVLRVYSAATSPPCRPRLSTLRQRQYTFFIRVTYVQPHIGIFISQSVSAGSLQRPTGGRGSFSDVCRAKVRYCVARCPTAVLPVGLISNMGVPRSSYAHRPYWTGKITVLSRNARQLHFTAIDFLKSYEKNSTAT